MKDIGEIRDRDMSLATMTKREFAAIMVMQGLLSDVETQKGYGSRPESVGRMFGVVVAEQAVSFADSLFDELEKHP